MVTEGKVCECKECIVRSLIFEHVSSEELGTFCNTKREQSFKKGQVVVRQGEPIADFVYVKDGLVKLYNEAGQGREQIISIARPYDFISLLTVFSETHYHYSVSAIEDTTVCIINLDRIKELVRENGSFALDLLERMSRTADKLIKNYNDINLKNLRGRIAYILLNFADKIYLRNRFDLPVSRKEIAELIGMTTENVIRILSEFRKEGIIRINGKEIEILDKAKLEFLSQHA
jgi:CRP/FNR family transcriptional regulator